MAQKKRVRLLTPKGVAKFPFLNRPNTRFKEEGEYSVNLVLNPADEGVQEFLQQLEELTEKAVEKAKNDLIAAGKKAKAKNVTARLPYRNEEDDEGDETGNVEIKFRQRAKGKTKDGREFEITIPLFDAAGQPMSKDIYGGSIIRINFTPNPYYVASTGEAGVSLLINAVQVIELRTRSTDASFFGFEQEEGYVESTESGEDENEDSGEDDVSEEDF